MHARDAAEPLKIALLGLGRRAWGCYFPILAALRDHIRVIAVCDPIPEMADRAAAHWDCPAYTSAAQLLRDRPMEAAVCVTPPESHHALSVSLSRSGVHNLVETPMAPAMSLCRSMVEEAGKAGVVLYVNEQFFRLPIIAMARQLIAAGILGDVHRATSFHGHTGYHNNSIWQVLAGQAPRTVNAIEHTMPLPRHLDGAARWQESETFCLRTYNFPGGMLVCDMAGNIKSAFGRCPRPGMLEIDGTLGTFVEQPYDDRPAPWMSRAEVRLVAPEDYEQGAYARSYPVQRVTHVEHRINIVRDLPHGMPLEKLIVQLPGGEFDYRNPMLEYGLTDSYLSAVAQGVLEFVRAVREGGPLEFDASRAATSQEMEEACSLSASRGGAPVTLPLTEDGPAGRAATEAIRTKHGVDPFDVEAMMNVAFPLNYDPRYSNLAGTVRPHQEKR